MRLSLHLLGLTLRPLLRRLTRGVAQGVAILFWYAFIFVALWSFRLQLATVLQLVSLLSL